MSTQSDLAELYTTFFNRAPDATGLAYWVNEISTGKLTLAQVAKNWTTQQAEGLASLPSTLTNTQFIDKIYANILGRTADTSGSTYWLNQLNSGAVTRDTFASSFINGAKANTTAQGVLDTTLINNKATVGVAFANKGVNDTTLASKVLTSVTADADTLASTLAVISLLPATTAAQTPAILASANAVLTKFAGLITAAPGEVADAATYLKALVGGVSSTTNIGTLLDNANTLLTSAATNPAALDNPASQGAAAVVVATSSTGGTTPAPSPTTINATAGKDEKTLTAGVDTFVTKFGVEAGKQINTVTLSGTYEAGDKINLEINGTTTSYTVLSGDIVVGNDSATITEIAAMVAALTVDSSVILAPTPTGLTLTAATAGTPFNATATSTNFAGTAPTAQVDTVVLSGSYGDSDIVRVTVGGNIVSYTLVTADIKGTDALTIEAVAVKVAAAITADSTVSAVVTASSSATGVTLTAKVAGVAFLSSADTIDGSFSDLQVATSSNTTANLAAGSPGANTQVISGANTKINILAADSLSTVGTLDVLTNFTVGSDKVHLLDNLGVATLPASLARVADVASSNDLAGTLASAFAPLNASQAGLLVISGGTAAGTYLFADNGNGVVDASADVFIKLVGVTPGAIGALDVGQYFA